MVCKAEEAFHIYKKASSKQKADLLESVASEIMKLGDELLDRASAETGLPIARITAERGRTVNQLNLFASLVREGSWKEVSIDTSIPDREPIPKPDLRKLLIPIGPVAVFTASNFPLAFSTAGGDTASALAAGNPVIVKGHNSHLGTHQLVVGAIKKAVWKCDLPEGVFGSLLGADFTLGQELVKHPAIKAVGFTGSFSGGKALYDIAVRRKEPIPVYAEMSSINPTVLLPNALSGNSASLAKSLSDSITMGVGQFCTNPGLLIGLDEPGFDRFAEQLKENIQQSCGDTMLNNGIHVSYNENSTSALSREGVELLGQGKALNDLLAGTPVVAITSGENFVSNPTLCEEVFGPYSLLVKCKDKEQLKEVLSRIAGQLTISFMLSEPEAEEYGDLIELAESKTGRIIFNGVPTGVEVCHSMVHGGPFPSTTDSRTTSVGTDAIKRFARPVCYQDSPERLLPDELKNENPLKIMRKINGEFTREIIG